jgi:trigger factor
LKIETQPLEDHQVKLTVEIGPGPLDEARRQAARKIAKRTKIPGFRPGKAPLNIVQRFVGEDVLLEESLEILINDHYLKIIEEAKITPYGPGKFNNILTLDPLTLEFTVPLMAEVTLGDYRSIRYPYEPTQVQSQDVENVLDSLRQRQAIEEPIDRPAQENDHLHVRLSAHRTESAEGTQAELFSERPISLIIAKKGEDTSDEWPFDGFSRELIGMAAGDRKRLVYTFPEESEFEDLRGVTAEFSVLVEDIKSRSLPELNDEFAQSVGEYNDLEALREEIKATLERRAKETYDAEYDDEVVTAAVDQATIKFPPQMLENEIEEVLHQLTQRLKTQNLDLETYKKTRGLDEDGLKDEARPVAESRVRRSLVLLEIAEAENIQVAKEELQAETERTLEAMTRFMSESELRKLSSQDLFPGLVGNILTDMRIARTLERLRGIASGSADTNLSSESSQEIPPVEEETESDLVDIKPSNAPEGIEASQETTPEGGDLISPV